MLLTKEDDYAIRVMRSIKDGGKHTVGDICQEEEIPSAFAYKIVRKLQKAGLVGVERGAFGGCRLRKELSAITLYDVLTAVDDEPLIIPCLRESCNRNPGSKPCEVHGEMIKIQEVLMRELKARKLSKLFETDNKEE